jgi:hypothetical protein
MMGLVGVLSFSAVTSTTSTSTTPGITHLSGSGKWVSVGLVVVFVLLAGAVVVWGRRALERPRQKQEDTSGAGTRPQAEAPDSTLVRSWVAISLVGGLLIFVAVSFWLDDTTLRSALVGGVIANAGSAVAFYFASKSSDQARQDILTASLGSTLVPNLVGTRLTAARDALAATPLRIEVHPAAAVDDAQVMSQSPAANQSASAGAPVAVNVAGPIPDLQKLTQAEAQEKLDAVGLSLDPSSSPPAPDTTITAQQPAANAPVPANLTVKATYG